MMRNRLSVLGIAVAAMVAALPIVGASQICFGQEADTVGASLGRVDTLIATARWDLGLGFDDHGIPGVVPDTGQVRPPVDYTDSEFLIRRLRILTKELAASGCYSKAELLDIKTALSEAERELQRLPEGAQRSGREAVERYFAVLQGM